MSVQVAPSLHHVTDMPTQTEGCQQNPMKLSESTKFKAFNPLPSTLMSVPDKVHLTKEDFKEPLLQENAVARYTMFPLVDMEIWKYYKKAVDSFWIVQEVDCSKDLADWNRLPAEDKTFVKMILGFFAASDGVVMENLAQRFFSEVQLSEARAFYGFQIAMENIHSEMYSILIDTYIKDIDEKLKLFHAIEHFPCITRKADWAMKYIKDTDSDFATRLVAFAIVEGVFFSSAFASIYWLKQRNILPGLTKSNEFIARDEGLHTEFAVLLYSRLNRRLPASKIYRIMKEAVDIEEAFVETVLPYKLANMNADLMKTYVRFVADRLLLQLGYDAKYHVTNPLPYMEMIGLESKVNFFEQKNSEYALANMTVDNGDLFSDTSF